MRRIEEKMVDAIRVKKNFFMSNTEVKVTEERIGNFLCKCVTVYLFGNEIWGRILNLENGDLKEFFSLAGYNTKTTKSRLRALGIDVTSKNSIAYYNGEALDSEKWYQK